MKIMSRYRRSPREAIWRSEVVRRICFQPSRGSESTFDHRLQLRAVIDVSTQEVFAGIEAVNEKKTCQLHKEDTTLSACAAPKQKSTAFTPR